MSPLLEVWLLGFPNSRNFSADGWNSLLMLQDCLEKTESQTDWSFSENPQVCIISTKHSWLMGNRFLHDWMRCIPHWLKMSQYFHKCSNQHEFACSFSELAGSPQSIFYSESRDRTSIESRPIPNLHETVFAQTFSSPDYCRFCLDLPVFVRLN